MLRDISNARPSRPGAEFNKKPRSSTAGFQRKSADSTSRAPSLPLVPSSIASTAVSTAAARAPRLSLQEQEEIQNMKRKICDLAKFPELFEVVLGAGVEDRRRRDDLVLFGPSNQKPPALLKNAQMYLKQELSRLSDGYRKQRELGEDFLRDLVALQHQYGEQFDTTLGQICTRRIEKSEAEHQLQELVARYQQETKEMAEAKGQLGREEEQVLRQTELAKDALLRVQAQVDQLALLAQEMHSQIKLQEEQAVGNGEEAQKLQSELFLAQQELDEEENRQKKLSLPGSDWEQRQIQLDIIASEAAVQRARNQVETAKQECAAARNETTKQDSQLDALKERAVEAENQLTSKDGNLNATLDVLMKTNEFNEKRIDKQTEEVLALQAKLSGMNADTQQVRDRLVQSRCTEDMLRDRHDALLLRIENELKRGCNEFELQTTTAMQDIKRYEHETSVGTTTIGRLKDEAERAMNALAVEANKRQELQLALQANVEVVCGMETELVEAREELESASGSSSKLDLLLGKAKMEESRKRRQGDCLESKEKVEWLKREVQEAKLALLAADAGVRVLWNELQTLKGNIRVIARVRPESSPVMNNMSRLVTTADSVAIELRGDQQRRPGAGAADVHSFHFNRVFSTDSTQLEVFEEVSEFVQSALDGYHVCLFSYGQTGSGKTWTMTGDLTSTRHRGIIPRSVDHILLHIAAMRERGWAFQVECSFVEIYNEKIRDLLNTKPGAGSGSGPDLEIQDVNGDIAVKGMRKQPIRDADELQTLLNNANRVRSVAATNKNAQSSRSHSIFTIHLVGMHSKSGEKILGSLGLCDLAGSERLKSSMVTGDRLKETQAINKSLSALSTVFGSLGRKDKHVSYRASTLTHILKPCLSGEGKTLMIVNLSSDHADAQESLCSLKFAQEVNKTELGKAKKNVQAAPQRRM
ncbi:hypothetical protein BASA81_011292 [Batrachochytrium salamandrivorans]|nr:hypothetical protein BASA81_011292 [Batrachochytrium salamandrivorans]